MGSTTRIDWADATWNPATGCLHGCEYCYARNIAHRFGGNTDSQIHTLETRQYKDGTWTPDLYPFGFAPTFHKYRLHEPLRLKKPRNIFVCSMADLFGGWVPNEWIRAVFDACSAAPQHRYLFLTKNPDGLRGLSVTNLPNVWIGVTVTNNYDLPRIQKLLSCVRAAHYWVCFEPLHSEIRAIPVGLKNRIGWVVIGDETGLRSGKIKAQTDWILDLSRQFPETPVCIKERLRETLGSDWRNEYPF